MKKKVSASKLIPQKTKDKVKVLTVPYGNT
jgi:hypothetical protein